VKVVNQSSNATARGVRLLCILLAATAAATALASGFIDERGGAKRVVAAPATGALVGDFSLKEWDQPAPVAPERGSALSLAIIRLLPPNRPAVEIDAPTDIVERVVHWSPGSRRQALQEIAARAAVNITIEGRSVTIRPVLQDPAAMAAATQPGIGAAPARPAAGKAFEVKLSDIKLSTAMSRWAADNGVRIRWDADKHVLIGAPMVFNAANTFDAVTQALSTPGIKNSDYPLEVCEYPNRPPLLRITRQGEQAKDCPQ